MSASVAILLAAFAISIAGFALKRRDADKVWTIGRKHSLDGGVYEFDFSVAFVDRGDADIFRSRLKDPSISTRVEPSPNQQRWVVKGNASEAARRAWYRAVLSEWTSALEGIPSASHTIVVTAAKAGVGSGFILSTDLDDGA